MQADIADALIARGNTARAALVLQRQARLFMREGWWDLAAAVLQRLLHCQKLLMQVSSLICCWLPMNPCSQHWWTLPIATSLMVAYDSVLSALLMAPHNSMLNDGSL